MSSTVLKYSSRVFTRKSFSRIGLLVITASVTVYYTIIYIVSHPQLVDWQRLAILLGMILALFAAYKLIDRIYRSPEDFDLVIDLDSNMVTVFHRGEAATFPNENLRFSQSDDTGHVLKIPGGQTVFLPPRFDSCNLAASKALEMALVPDAVLFFHVFRRKGMMWPVIDAGKLQVRTSADEWL